MGRVEKKYGFVFFHLFADCGLTRVNKDVEPCWRHDGSGSLCPLNLESNEDFDAFGGGGESILPLSHNTHREGPAAVVTRARRDQSQNGQGRCSGSRRGAARR